MTYRPAYLPEMHTQLVAARVVAETLAYAEGGELPNPGAKLAGPSFDEWLAAA